MGLGLSLLLDALRFLAASTVAIGHSTQHYFNIGWPGATRLAIESVAVFFLLSGFVIRHTVLNKDKTLSQYALGRSARIYSVVVPALLLTVVLDSISRSVNPDFYAFWADQATAPVQRLALSSLFLGEAWRLDVSPLSNSPFWSLNYECIYYAAFGCWFYLRGAKRALALTATGLLIGPKVFLLFPIWLMGVWLYDNLSRLTRGRRGSIGLLVVAGTLYALWFGLRLPEQAEIALLAATGPQLDEWLGPSRHIADFYVVALAGALALVGANGMMSSLERVLVPFARPIRLAASATFSTYLYHFPLLVFFASIWPYDKGSSAAKLSVLALTLGSCFLLSRVTETRKDLAARTILALARAVLAVGRGAGRKPQFLPLETCGELAGSSTGAAPAHSYSSDTLATPNAIADGDKHDR
jgi:peptidoglycan/LPS O-acetylase OafA/YrhL